MICHQRLKRDEYLSEGTPPGVNLDLRAASIERVSYQYAKGIILKYEWLGRMSATRYHYALMDADGWHCLGVACIGGQNCTGASYTHRMFGVEVQQLGVFARGACVHFAPHNANSRLVAGACRPVAKDSPYKLLVAYADPRAGEIGTIYQACNWIYIGRSAISYRYVSPDGQTSFSDARIIVEAQKRGLRWKDVNREYLDNGWTKEKQAAKYRYVYLLDRRDKALRERVEAMRQPHPKRESV